MIPNRIAEGVAERTAELEKVCERERQIAELRLDEYNKLTRSYNRLLKKSQNDKSTYEFNLSQRDYAIAILKAAFQKAVELLDVVCRKALQAVIVFAQNRLPNGSHTSKPVQSMISLIPTQTDYVLPIL